jgi:hypothetical protein
MRKQRAAVIPMPLPNPLGIRRLKKVTIGSAARASRLPRKKGKKRGSNIRIDSQIRRKKKHMEKILRVEWYMEKIPFLWNGIV